MELKRDPENGEFKHEFFPTAICLDSQHFRTELDKIEWILVDGYDRDVTQSSDAI